MAFKCSPGTPDSDSPAELGKNRACPLEDVWTTELALEGSLLGDVEVAIERVRLRVDTAYETE